jgi:chromosome segregation protein
LHGQV